LFFIRIGIKEEHILENENAAPDEPATADEIRAAIDALRPGDFTRLHKAATLAMYGSEYAHPFELVNEAIARSLAAASGGKGRKWTRPIEFMAFMIMTIRGIANDSLESPAQKKTVRYQEMAVESAGAEDALAHMGHAHPSVEEELMDSQETRLRRAKAKQDCEAIESHFDGDQMVGCVILGMKEGMSPKEICEFAEIDKTKHDSARTKIRRAMEMLFPGRRAK
jgi:hypothetical protein